VNAYSSLYFRKTDPLLSSFERPATPGPERRIVPQAEQTGSAASILPWIGWRSGPAGGKQLTGEGEAGLGAALVGDR